MGGGAEPVAVALLVLGVLGAVVAPFALSRANPGQLIPRHDNRGIVLFSVTYGLGVAAFLVGALLAAVPPLFGALLALPMVLVVRAHNARAA